MANETSDHATVENAELFHERGIHLPTRTLYLGSESVTDEGESGCDARMAERLVKNLHLLESLGSEEVTIVMNNVGGDEYHGLAIYDAIRQAPMHSRIVVRGHAMSMGSWILQAADERIMGPHATLMLHYGTWGFYGHARTAWKVAVEGERLSRLMEETYLGRIRDRQPDYTLRKLKALLEHDTFLDAQEAVALGLADSVG